MKAKVSGGGRVSGILPERAMRQVPSPLPLDGNGGGRAAVRMSARASGQAPFPLPSNSGGRGKAKGLAPDMAILVVPSPARRPSKSGKRGQAKRLAPAKANRLVPSSASPDPKAGGGGQRVVARKGQTANASLSAPVNGKDGHARAARKGHPSDAIPPAPHSRTRGQPRVAREGHVTGAPRPASDLTADLTADLSRVFLLYEQRRDLLSTASGMTNRLKALTKIRRGLPVSAKVSEAMILETPYPPIDTLLSARGVLRDHLGKIEKELEQFAEDLPAYASFWKPQRGLSGLGLALIAGDAGDLAGYSTHSKLWRRFGLHVDGAGRAYWKRRPGLSAEDWESAGYCPRRRSIIFQLTDSLLKAQIRKDEHDPDKRVALGEYGALYLREKARQQEKAKAEGLTVCPAAKIPAKAASKYRSEGHIHNRAARYVGKKLLRDLWKVWRREASHTEPKGHADVASRSPSKSAGRVMPRMPAMASTRLPSPPSSPAT